MVQYLLLWAHFAITTYAKAFELPASESFSPGPGDSTVALQAFEDAGRRPNASDSFTFSRDFNNTQENWTWRINVTDLAIPNEHSELGSPSASYSRDSRVANTQWQLQWPGDSDTFQSFLSERNVVFSFNALSIFLPSNVTDLYNADDSGNCTNLLGSECTQSITREMGTTGDTLQIGFPSCQNKIGVMGFLQPGGAAGLLTGTSNYTGPVTRDSTWFYSTSRLYVGRDLRYFDRAKNAVQVLAMNFRSQDGVNEPMILCRVVEKAPTSTTTPEAGTPEVGSAVSWTRSTAVLWGMVMLSTLAIML